MEIGENTVIDEPEVDEEVPESPKTGDGGATGYALLIGMMALMGMAIVTRKE
ncbi:MAG: LPXTG cell wall anchor domain-containing protein [Clostridiales bacterium]|nr:LPXTG cell wall anchor domain-containing protein [Clostridiales bacterium]